MGFVHGYNGAMRILASIGNGKCSGTCKSIWMRNIRYALKTKTNPLKLTATQRRSLTQKVNGLSGSKSTASVNKTLKKYKERKSPPYPANENCGKRMKGNDENMYESRANKNGVCSWKKVAAI